MENMLQKLTVPSTRYVLNVQEDCAITGDYMLPDYCPDIAVVLKCVISPWIQNRHWSGNQLLLDGTAAVRILYLDEERRCIRQAEFTQPLSCALQAEGQTEDVPVLLEAETKYVNCRAVGPRRLEVRGAITVTAKAACAVEEEVMTADEKQPLFTRCETADVTTPVFMAEKILTISESMDFPDDMPPAEQLLTGECRAVLRECKLLTGKAIVKGQVLVHQLYTDDSTEGTTHCLDFVMPFSQILDVSCGEDSVPYVAHVQLLADSQRCAAGQRGENTVLCCDAKLLIQLQLYKRTEVSLLLDAYHKQCPCALDKKEQSLYASLGCRWEQTVLPMQLELPSGQIREVVDVWVQPQSLEGNIEQGTARLSGRLLICMLVREEEGQVVYYERSEEYQLEYACPGNGVEACATVTERHYRVNDNKLELQVSLHVALYPYACTNRQVVQSIDLHTDTPYPAERATVKLYYAQAGESLWDIGRSCHTSPEQIQTENGLGCECLAEPTVLLIPLTT